LTKPSEEQKSRFPLCAVAAIVISNWVPLIFCAVLLVLDARFAGHPPAGWDRGLTLAVTMLSGVACLMNVLSVAYHVASVWKRRPLPRGDERMFSAVAGVLTYAFLDGWGVSRLGGHPSSVLLWATIAGAALGVVSSFFFEMQRALPVLARIRAHRRSRRPSEKSDQA
jgi:hypothetical protein